MGVLATRMREGSRKAPQGFEDYYDRLTGGVCALAAVALETGTFAVLSDLEEGDIVDEILERSYPSLLERFVPCPAPDCDGFERDGQRLRELIAHLNDEHRWTREAIADWLESIGE